MRRILGPVLFLAMLCGAALSGRADDLASAIAKLQATGPDSQGQRDAQQAWPKVAACEVSQLPTLLAALDKANPIAANWIRTAIDAVVDRARAQGRRLPAAELEEFTRDAQHVSAARRLAYELLLSVDASARDRIIPGMLNDPSLELRRDAVEMLVTQAQAVEKQPDGKSLEIYRKAFDAARDFDQIQMLAARLKKAGQAVDPARHMGFVVKWHVIGPFDNHDGVGFDAVYPPEKEVRLDAEYPGKKGPVKWKPISVAEPYGTLDLNKALAEEKGVVAYAASRFVAKQKRTVDFRLTSVNAVKLWLNGKPLDARKVYHGGSQMDQYVSRGTLEPGQNTILVKTCQNEQTDSWAKIWQFQLRVCDEIGTAVLSADREAP
jgi:hypothetical protein